jgi:hypothetical protein
MPMSLIDCCSGWLAAGYADDAAGAEPPASGGVAPVAAAVGAVAPAVPTGGEIGPAPATVGDGVPALAVRAPGLPLDMGTSALSSAASGATSAGRPRATPQPPVSQGHAYCTRGHGRTALELVQSVLGKRAQVAQQRRRRRRRCSWQGRHRDRAYRSWRGCGHWEQDRIRRSGGHRARRAWDRGRAGGTRDSGRARGALNRRRSHCRRHRPRLWRRRGARHGPSLTAGWGCVGRVVAVPLGRR